MSKSEYMQALPLYFVSILSKARFRELEMKHRLETSSATVMGTGMQAQAQALGNCSCLCDIVFGSNCRI